MSLSKCSLFFRRYFSIKHSVLLISTLNFFLLLCFYLFSLFYLHSILFLFFNQKQYWLYFALQQLNFTTPLPFSPFIRSSSIRQSRSARALNFRQKCAPAILCDVFRLRFWLLLEFTGFLMNRILRSETRLEIFYGAEKNYNCFSCDRIFRRCSCFDFHLSMQKDEVLYLQEMMLNLARLHYLVTLYGLNA